ncbi:hypothetical protein [Nocardioides sp. W7]|uniref:hypothetical protein n=1 Tax=Nocardioides sp. W7 TaxID=2931390 RepID=UPI0024690D38|nr:hypothetical protein [Nocardioides sp. W7]
MPLQFDAWPAQLVDRYVRSARALCDENNRLTPAQLNDLERLAGLVDLTDWHDDEVRGFMLHVLETAGLAIAEPAPEPTPVAAPEPTPEPAPAPAPPPAKSRSTAPREASALPALKPAPKPSGAPLCPGPGGIVVALDVAGGHGGVSTATSLEKRGGTDVICYRGNWGVQASGRLWHRPSGETIDFPDRVLHIARTRHGHRHALVTASGEVWLESTGSLWRGFRRVQTDPSLGHLVGVAIDSLELMTVDTDGWVTSLTVPETTPPGPGASVRLRTVHRHRIAGATQVSSGAGIRMVMTNAGVAHVGDGIRWPAFGSRPKPPRSRRLAWAQRLPALRQLGQGVNAIDWTGSLITVYSPTHATPDTSGRKVRLLRGDTALTTDGVLLRRPPGGRFAPLLDHKLADVIDIDGHGEGVIVVTKDPDALCAAFDQLAPGAT